VLSAPPVCHWVGLSSPVPKDCGCQTSEKEAGIKMEWVSYFTQEQLGDLFIANYFTHDQLRDILSIMTFYSAIFVGGYLAWVATNDAGLRCFQAFVRLIHRFVLLALSVAMMGFSIVEGEHKSGPGWLTLVFFLFTLSCTISALRYHFWMGDIPTDASWRNPHFPKHRTEKQAVIEAVARRKAG
jgi:hypothetical protein